MFDLEGPYFQSYPFVSKTSFLEQFESKEDKQL